MGHTISADGISSHVDHRRSSRSSFNYFKYRSRTSNLKTEWNIKYSLATRRCSVIGAHVVWQYGCDYRRQWLLLLISIYVLIDNLYKSSTFSYGQYSQVSQRSIVSIWHRACSILPETTSCLSGTDLRRGSMGYYQAWMVIYFDQRSREEPILHLEMKKLRNFVA